MKRKWIALSTIAATLTLAACTNGANDTVAKTSAGNVTKDELYQTMLQTHGADTLYTLLVQKVAVANVKDKAALENEVNEFIAQRTQTAGGAAQFLTLVKSYGYENEEAFKQAVYANRAVAQVLKEKVSVTDEEIQAAYETYEPAMKASHILVSEEAKAKEIIESLKQGGDWNTLASENSLDTANKNNGGSLGEFKPSAMTPAFAEAAKAMSDGQISEEPVKTNFGFHIIKMESNPSKKSLEEEKENVRKDLIEKKLKDQAVQKQIVSELLQSAQIEISNEHLKKALSTILTPQTSSESSSNNTTNETTTDTSSNK